MQTNQSRDEAEFYSHMAEKYTRDLSRQNFEKVMTRELAKWMIAALYSLYGKENKRLCIR